MAQNASTRGGSAPMLGVLRPQVYRFKLGSFEVTRSLMAFASALARIQPLDKINQPKPCTTCCG